MSKARSKVSSAGLDTAVIEDLQSTSVIGVYEDLTPTVSFVQKNGLVRSFNNILYFSAANDLGQLTKTTQNLSIVLDVINYVLGDKSPSANLSVKLSLLEESERINEVYTTLCSNLKVVYKVYGMRKPAVTTAITKLLQSLVEYDNSNIFSQLIDNFDFNQSAVQNILVPTRDNFERKIIDEKSMRWAFVDLWISICSKSNPTLRKTLLTNFKIMNNFWKYMDMEKFETINKILDFLDRSVCSEPTFKRATKCRILNENFLYNFRSLFPLVKSENDRDGDNEDIHDFKDFKVKFITFMNTLVSDSNKGITYPENEFGSPLVVNNVTFNINNKLIYTLLTAMKPWDSFPQLQFVMQILNHNHELLPPYMHWIVSNSGGYHEPTLSSYWIGHTLLYSEILKSKSLPLKEEFVSLFPLSKNALTECISFPSDLINQLGLQLILLQLQKLSNATKVTQSFKDFVLSNLPPHAVFLPLLSHKNKLIRLTATSIIAAQEELAPKSSSSATVGLISKELGVLNANIDECNNFDLILLDMYLSIQSNNELKWWNKVSKENSFFTSLLKFSNVPLLRNKILKILQKLTKPTLVFNEKNVVESPLLVLIETTASFDDVSCLEKLWGCLDETISRAVSSPYKYLDKSHEVYGDLSIFMVVLFEQITFVPDLQNETNVLKWLNMFATRMVVIGEPAAGIEAAAQDANVNLALTLTELEAPENITSKLSFAETVFVLDNTIRTKGDTEKIFGLMANMGNYLTSIDHLDSSLSEFISSPINWKFLLRLSEAGISDQEILASYLFSELVATLDIDYENSKIRELIFKVSLADLNKKNQAIVKKFLWILSFDQLRTISTGVNNNLLLVKANEILMEKNVDFKPDLSKLMAIDSSDVHKILSDLQPSVDQIDFIIKTPKFFYLLERKTPEMEVCLLRAADLPDALLYKVGAFYPQLAKQYQVRITHLALSMENWENSLNLFAARTPFFDADQLCKLVFSRSESSTKQAMSSSFADFVKSLAGSSVTVSEEIRGWMQKAMLYVTKRFAESASLSKPFVKFLGSLENLIENNKNLLGSVPINIIDAQLQAVLSSKIWGSQTSVLEYVNHVVFSLKPKALNSDKLLQLFVNNEKNPLNTLPNGINAESRYQASLVIYSLFHSNEDASSTMALLESVLVLYLGSQRAEDLLIKHVLQRIEKNLTQSWVSRITSWDYQDEISQEEFELVGQERLFIKDASSFVVALNKKFVRNTIESGLNYPEIPNRFDYKTFEEFASQCSSSSHQDTTYDPEFLMLLIINNEELVKETEGKLHFNIGKFVDSELLSFVITSLACHRVREIAKIILMGVLKDLCDEDTPYKDKNIMKVYISSILHTIRVADHSVPLVWSIIGSFCAILANPGHHLYERVQRYVLSTPIIKSTDVPLFNSVILCLNSEDSVEEDDYHKPVNWLIEQMTKGIKNSEDLKLIKSRDVLEWILNIYHSNYASTRLRLRMLNFIFSVQRIGPDGSDMLVTKFAGLSALEIMKRSSSSDSLNGLQELLNVDQLALRVGALKGQKRVKEWTHNNVERAVKRIHLA